MSGLVVPCVSAERYFNDFPIVFCDYEEKMVLGTSDKSDFFRVIAEKVAQLYVNSMQSPMRLNTFEFSSNTHIEKEKIEAFGKTLQQYIFAQLSNDKSVSLATEKTPQSELKEILKSCQIELEAHAENGLFFLPYKSKVFLAPYIMEEYGSLEGLRVFMQRV